MAFLACEQAPESYKDVTQVVNTCKHLAAHQRSVLCLGSFFLKLCRSCGWDIQESGQASTHCCCQRMKSGDIRLVEQALYAARLCFNKTWNMEHGIEHEET